MTVENTGTVEKYAFVLRLLHWLMAVVLLGLIALGWYMSELPREDPNKFVLYGLHKSFGILALLLVSVRLVVRKSTVHPPAPRAFSVAMNRLSHNAHMLLYALMLVVPLSGYTLSVAGGHPVQLFGIPIPALLPENDLLHDVAEEAHEVLPWVLLAVVVAHVLGVIKHRLVEKYNLLPRISLW